MNGIDVLRFALNTSSQLLEPLLDDVSENPLAPPTSHGGNHALWIVGHLAYSEASICSMMTGQPNPLEHWSELFAGGTTPLDDSAAYPSFDDVRAEFKKTREQTFKLLDTLSEADLDKSSNVCPDEWKPFFGTFGKCLTIGSLHPMHHRGQVADIRYNLQRKPLIS